MARFSFRDFFGRQPKVPENRPTPSHRNSIVVGAQPNEDNSIRTFDNSNITYRSNLTDINYDDILRDKQRNIVTLYQLSDYYTDADPIVHGINKHVYVPFASGDYYLTGDNQKTIEIFEDYYNRIRLRELIDDVLLQFFKYSNVFVYVWNGRAITLPPHKCVIANILFDGTPVVDFDVRSIKIEYPQRTYTVTDQPGTEDKAFEDVVVKYEVDIKMVAVDFDMLLTGDKGEAAPEFQ